jgi:predicted membrane metal-binding protein
LRRANNFQQYLWREKIITPTLNKKAGITMILTMLNGSQQLTVEGPPQLNAQTADPLKVMQIFAPKSKNKLAGAQWVYDLGSEFFGHTANNR